MVNILLGFFLTFLCIFLNISITSSHPFSIPNLLIIDLIPCNFLIPNMDALSAANEDIPPAA